MPIDPPKDRRPQASIVPGAPAAAFFDVNNTIIRGASTYHVVRELYRRDFFSLTDIVLFAGHAFVYLSHGESRRQIAMVRDRALRIIEGRSVAEMIAVAEEVYEEVLATKVFPGTRSRLDEHLAAGHQVWLVTASPQEVGELIARRLGATGAVGTVAEEHGGIYTGRLAGPLMHGERKAVVAQEIARREGLDLRDCYAYGDSVNDIPILAAVGHPCAINPEARLRRYCREMGWPVLDVHRRRSSARRKAGNTAAAAGAVWALSVVLRTILRRIRSRLLP